MSSDETMSPAVATAFPEKGIEVCIRDFLASEAETQAALHGDCDANSGIVSPATTSGPQPVIDSLVVVEVLLEIEPLVPFELPDSFVRTGGYESIDEVIGHLIPKLKEKWDKHHKEKK